MENWNLKKKDTGINIMLDLQLEMYHAEKN